MAVMKYNWNGEWIPITNMKIIGEIAELYKGLYKITPKTYGEYDDYEDDTENAPEPTHWADRTVAVAKRTGSGAARRLGAARRWVQEKIRHSDRRN